MESQLIALTKENIATEHICCALGDKKNNEGVKAKKHWLAERMDEGLKFIKLNVRGKVFIEYLPADKAWLPVDAPGYTFINCLWVSGSFKNKGYGKLLLETCEKDSSGSNGIIVISSKKKKPFMADKAFFLKQGYQVCDYADPYFELVVKRFDEKAPLPKFTVGSKNGLPASTRGVDIFFTPQCPFTLLYTELLKPVIDDSEIPVRLHPIKSREEAYKHVSPLTTYSVFVNGKYVTNEILTPAKLEKLLKESL